jgi:hypothetical protein
LWQPSGAKKVFGILKTQLVGIGREKPHTMSSVMLVVIAS